jgi:2,5-diketo-D-gluconate reductase B
VALLAQAVAVSPAPLVCNQVEYHPFLDQSKIKAACAEHGVALVAYSPIAQGHAKKDEVLTRIGAAHGKSAAQVSLRWLVQQGVAAIPRTSRIERLSQNIEVFDFELSDAEMHDIFALGSPKGRLVNMATAPQWD